MREPWNVTEIMIEGESIPCRLLQRKHIQMIDDALNSLGEYGEVRLVVERGRLRFLVTQKSYDLLKWHAGETVRAIEP
jgi:hypothetical protein